MRGKSIVGLAFVLAAGLLTVACGDGAPTASSSGSNNVAAPGTVVSGQTANVTVNATDGLVFDPVTATAKVGQVVEWKNTGQIAHTVTFDSSIDPNGTISTSSLTGGGTFEVKFTQAGTFNYVCTIHAPNMKGTITVTS